jgi:branched-chain amino acid aminotransferase
MKKYFNYNGRFFADDENVLSKDDRSYRYGDGLFETMKLINGNILLEDYHFESCFRV